MRRLVVVLLCLAAAACGADEPADEVAGHLDPRSDAVIAVDLDYESGNWRELKALYERLVASGLWDGESTPQTLDALLEELAGSDEVSFAEDLRPLLGGTLYLGVAVEPAEPLSAETRDVLDQLDVSRERFTADGRAIYFRHDGRRLDAERVERALQEEGARDTPTVLTAAYRVPDPDALRRFLDKLREQGLAPQPIPGVEDAEELDEGLAVVGGDTLVAVSGSEDEVATLLPQRAAAGEGPPLPELGDDLVAVRAEPGLLAAAMDRQELDRALATPAGSALRGAEASLRMDEAGVHARGRVDFEGLPDAELPLPPAGDLALASGEAIASASADQSYTTTFLARLARALWPESRFVQRVQAYEAESGVRFEDEVLRQFAGPSLSILRPGDPPQFAARSTLADPEAMRARLASLAPALPGILEGLEGLGTTGLAGLLLVAPDAPLTPSAFALLAQVGVDRLDGGPGEQLYEVTGADLESVPERVVYGMVGDAFVVASSEALAREVATLPTEPAPAAGTRLRLDTDRLLDDFGAWASAEDVRVARELLAGGEASASAEDGDVVAEGELRFAR